jgi:hypothetical protein
MLVDDKSILVGDKPVEVEPITATKEDIAACAILPVCVDASIQTDVGCADHVSMHKAQMREGGAGGERVRGDRHQRQCRPVSAALSACAPRHFRQEHPGTSA